MEKSSFRGFRPILSLGLCLLGAHAQSPAPEGPAPGPRGPEFHLALLFGPASFQRTTVVATVQPSFFGPSTTLSQEVAFSRGEVGGLRLGLWGSGALAHAGFASDLEGVKAKAEEVDLNLVTLTFIPMLQAPLWPSEAQPGGRLNLYAGLGLKTTVDGKATVRFGALPRPASGKLKGQGFELLAGLSLRLGPAILLLEHRESNLDLTFSDLGDQGKVKLGGGVTVFGAAWRF